MEFFCVQFYSLLLRPATVSSLSGWRHILEMTISFDFKSGTTSSSFSLTHQSPHLWHYIRCEHSASHLWVLCLFINSNEEVGCRLFCYCSYYFQKWEDLKPSYSVFLKTVTLVEANQKLAQCLVFSHLGYSICRCNWKVNRVYSGISKCYKKNRSLRL
jgi:hypothetical protein